MKEIQFKQLFSLFLFVIISSALLAQGIGNVWYLGDKVGVRFTNNGVITLNDGQLRIAESIAVICDDNDSLMFYSDGKTIYNAKQEIMANGSGLYGCSSATQGSLIVKKPCDDDIYYLFTTNYQSPNNGFYYNVIDMSLDSGYGELIGQKNRPLLAGINTTEKLAGVMHSNGQDVWVITKQKNSSDFLAYLVTSSGLSAPVVSTTGAYISSFQGALKSNHDGNRLFCCNYSIDRIGQLLSFNNTTGAIVQEMEIPSLNGAFDVEFSPDNNLLYVCATTVVFQVDLSSGDSATINASRQTVGTTGGGYLSGIQLGPDGKIYITRNGVYFLASVNYPNSKGAGCNFIASAVDLNGKSSGLGLPNYVYGTVLSPKITADFSYSNGCTLEVPFLDSSTANVSDYYWDFGDGDTSSAQNPIHTYASEGSYNVSLIASNGCNADTISKTLNVAVGSLQVSLGNDTAICIGDSIELDAGFSGANYTWSNTDTLQVIHASTGGTYSVDIDDNGCSGFDEIIISINPLSPVSISDNISLCEGDSTTITITGGEQYLWSTGETTISLVAKPDTGISTYTVVVERQCGADTSLSAIVSVYLKPIADAGNDTTIELGSSVQLNGSGGISMSSYSWTPSSDLDCDDCYNPTATPTATTTYTFRIENGSCTSSDEIIIKLEEAGPIFVANVFSPNGDSNNDVLYVQGAGTGIQEITFMIFNRWGNKVFESTDINQGWDGKHKGKELNNAVFVYYVQGTYTNGEPIEKKGNVTLIR